MRGGGGRDWGGGGVVVVEFRLCVKTLVAFLILHKTLNIYLYDLIRIILAYF